MKIGVVDYQASNLGSIRSALRELGLDFFVSTSPKDFSAADLILLPGVGSFAEGMRNLIDSGLDVTISNHSDLGKPILGICLGMHLLATKGNEGGKTEGLDLISGEVIKMVSKEDFRVPHIGWDVIQSEDKQDFVYFAHSYFFNPTPNPLTKIQKVFLSGVEKLPAQVQFGNISGMQYHPEKSGKVGLRILQSTISALRSNS